MKRIIIARLALYRYRYFLGYILCAGLILWLLAGNISSLPYGLSRDEMDSVVTSVQLTTQGLMNGDLIDAPYHVVQKLSINIFGIDPIGVRLPSVLAAIVIAGALAVTLRFWFHANIALLTSLMVVTSVSFMTLGRLGTPQIMPIVWTSLLLMGAALAMRDVRPRWLVYVGLVGVVGLSLYTPMMLYPLIAFCIAGFLHPHIRYMVRRVSWPKRLVAIALFVLLIVPLVWLVIRRPQAIGELLGIPAQLPGLEQIAQHALTLVRGMVGSGTVNLGAIAAPSIGLASASLMLLGLARVVTHRHSVRSYMLLIWCVLMLPLVLLVPVHITIYFVPLILLLAIGLETLIDEWYSLFPYNPYARIVALLPLTVLLGGIGVANISQYFYSQAYNPLIAHQYSTTPLVVNRVLAEAKQDITIIAPPDEAAFYDILGKRSDQATTSTVLAPAATLLVIERTGLVPDQTYKVSRLYANGWRDDALLARLYVRQ